MSRGTHVHGGLAPAARFATAPPPLRGLLSIVALGAFALGACRALPEITPGVCGNGVLDPGEDCDGFGQDGLVCHPPGENGQCHLDCSPGPDGKATACPARYGCDAAHACRRATGAYTPLSQRILGNATSLTSGDFDGDGLSDVISQEREVLGATKIRAHYFDRSAAHTHTWTSNDPFSRPTLLSLPRDGRQSLAAARFGGVTVLTGEPDGSLISEALPSYFLDGTDARVFSVSDDPVSGSVSFVTMARLGGERGLFREEGKGPAARLVLAAALQFGVKDLAADPLVATLFEDDANPCRDVVLAARDSLEISVYSLCEHGLRPGEVIWRTLPEIVRLPLPPAARITLGLVAADFDGNGHLDLMVGTGDGNYVAYGDGARFSKPERAPIIILPDAGIPETMPLAAGDLSGDRRADLVLPYALFMSDPQAPKGSPPYRPVVSPVNTQWSEAAIADFNRDGLLDAVAISQDALDISFLLGTGDARSNLFTIPTNRPIDHVAVGDFDGDLINDVAIVQKPAVANGEAEVAIAFGNPSGAPGVPRVAARVPEVQQILSFRNTPENDVSFLGVLYRQKNQYGGDGSALALLVGNTDRNLPCVVELTSFSSDRSLAGGRTANVAVGAFTTPGVPDVLALALARSDGEPVDPPPKGPLQPPFQLWLLRDIGSRRGDPAGLAWSFPPDLVPQVDNIPRATMASGNLDGNDLDELVLAGADTTSEKCLLFVTRIKTDGVLRAEPSPPIVLDHPCIAGVQMSVVDLDGDGARDVVLLLGPERREHRLLALWGDGSGNLDPGAVALLVPESEQPSAFTLLGGGSKEPASVVYTTPGAVRMIRARANDHRSFDDAGVLATLASGTGIVAADVNGDGVMDLAVADEGAVRILRAELETQ